MTKIARIKTNMCKNKANYFSAASAMKVAEKFNQKVYECPVCFCFHLTSKENWREDYVDADYHRRMLIDTENRVRGELKVRMKALNHKINHLEREVALLKRAKCLTPKQEALIAQEAI